MLPARNLALAEEQGLDICAVCNSCAGTLAEANHKLTDDEALRGEVAGRSRDDLALLGGETVRDRIRIHREIRVLTAQQRLTALRRILSLGNANTVTKRAVSLLGHPVGPARRPVAEPRASRAPGRRHSASPAGG